MKITCSKRDDILKRRAEYESDYNARTERYNQQRAKYHEASQQLKDAIRQTVEAGLSKFDMLEFTVKVDSSYRDDRIGYNVRVECNENSKFADNSALSWQYNVNLKDNGSVTRETGSWSGLQAVTAEQMDSLRQTVSALEYLNSVNWESLVAVQRPDPSDYITERDPAYDPNKPDFDKELIEAELEEAIGTNTLIQGLSPKGVRVWYKLLKQTPKQYEVAYVSAYHSKSPEAIKIDIDKEAQYPIRIAKDKLYSLLEKPLTTMEV